MDPNGFTTSTGRPGTGRVSREAFATMTQVCSFTENDFNHWENSKISDKIYSSWNFQLPLMTYMQVDEEKKVEAVRDFYNNLGSFSIVDKLQIVSKYQMLRAQHVGAESLSFWFR